MENKTIIIILIFAVVVAAALVGVYFIRHNKPPSNSFQNTAQQNQTSDLLNPATNTSTNQTSTQANNPASTIQPQSKMITDDFSIDLPAGWKQTAPAMGASAMAVNADENINDPAAQKINFKSYFAVSYDTLKGKNINGYSQTIKNGLSQTFPDAVFANEQDITINGNSAHAMEVEFIQQGVSFKILMVAVAGQGDDAWVISFNTTKSAWEGYKEMFYNVANSFIIKK